MSPMAARNRKVEQGDATRATLVRAAITQFTEEGYAAASTTSIVAMAHVTRGALYHHFPIKEDLFLAALETVEEDVYHQVIRAINDSANGGADLPARISAGAGAFLDACLERPVQRILLQDGPSVLGWPRWQRLDNPRCARRLLADGIAEAIRARILPDQPAEPLTHLLYGALVQAGLVIADSEDPKNTRDAMGHAVGDLLCSLFASHHPRELPKPEGS
jgi:AcrR family transcriptional regulator